MSIFDAAMSYEEEGVPVCVIAGKEYGSGSSRDWAAKGPRLLGVRFVLAQSYERIHRSNLVGMGVLPLQADVELSGSEVFSIPELEDGQRTVEVTADGSTFEATVRIDTPNEWQYYRAGGILPFVLKRLG
jgi:aconitate hydratase